MEEKDEHGRTRTDRDGRGEARTDERLGAGARKGVGARFWVESVFGRPSDYADLGGEARVCGSELVQGDFVEVDYFRIEISKDEREEKDGRDGVDLVGGAGGLTDRTGSDAPDK